MEATRIGSAGSVVPGQPVFTLQYEQARVQVSPRIMNVAVPRSQHSPMFGHAASSQTVFKLAPLIFLRISRKLSPPGALTLNQSGKRRSTVGDPVCSDLETNVFRLFPFGQNQHVISVLLARYLHLATHLTMHTVSHKPSN